MTLQQRIENLETQLNQLRRRGRRMAFLAGLLFCGGLGLLNVQPVLAPPTNAVASEVVARTFVVVDDKGNRRAAFGFMDGVVGLSISDGNGQPRLTLAHTPKVAGIPEVSCLALFDSKGILRTNLSVRDDGSCLQMSDSKGNMRLATVVANDDPAVELRDKSGSTRAKLMFLSEYGPSLDLYDEKEVERIKLTLQLGGPDLILYDQKNRIRTVLGAFETKLPEGRKVVHPESSLLFFGADGKLLQTLP